jgi:prepilin-type N-terminal cleavage/methylation domain-containing protein
MKRDRNFHAVRVKSGFTLIEMIGVMAIMAILAAVVVPNGLRAIDRASVSAEQKTLTNLGGEVRRYLHDYGSPPGTATWAADISAYSEISQLNIATNTRQMNRLYFLDPDPTPGAFHMRAIILSSMRQGMTLPTSLTTAQFDALWRTLDGTVPSSASWNGWTAFAADYLVIERVNFKADYHDIILSNSSGLSTPPVSTIAAYEVRSSRGVLIQSGTVQPGNSFPLTLVQNVRINLYPGPTATGNIDFTYVVNTTPKQIDFKNLHWSPQ